MVTKTTTKGMKNSKPATNALGNATPMPTARVSKSEQSQWNEEERKMKARHAFDDIMRAQGHMRDRELMRDVKAHAKDQMKTMAAITGKTGQGKKK